MENESGMRLTAAEWKTVRKALQIVLMAHTVTETSDGVEIRGTNLEELIRKIRELEEREDIT